MREPVGSRIFYVTNSPDRNVTRRSRCRPRHPPQVRQRAIVVLCQKQSAHPAYPTRKIFYLQCGIGGMSGIKSEFRYHIYARVYRCAHYLLIVIDEVSDVRRHYFVQFSREFIQLVAPLRNLEAP